MRLVAALVLTAATLVAPAAAAKPGAETAETRTTAAGVRNPVKESAPDPQMFWYQGNYYLTYTSDNRIAVSKAASVTELATAPETVIWRDTTSSRCCGMWAPELHFLDGRWYVYYTATDSSGAVGNHRMHVLESAGTDPLGPYTYKARLAASSDHYSLDGTVLTMPDGRRYAIWSGWEPGTTAPQNLYIAPMSNPWTTSGPRVLLSRPQYAWEMDHAAVNEGAAPLWRNGRLFLAYSASGCTSPNYALGLLTLNGTNPLDPAQWTKSPQPVFQASAANSAYTTAHNSFFSSPDGTETWMAYHGVTNQNGSCGGDRATRIQKVNWRPDGTPDFGVPVSTGTTLALPAGDPGTNQVPAGDYVLTAVHSGQALDVIAGSHDDGANVLQWPYFGQAFQQWRVQPQADGSYRLTAVHSGKDLDVAWAADQDGADVIQWPANGGANQRWYLDAVGNGVYRVSSKIGGRALDVDHASAENGANVLVWQYLYAPNQKWRLEPVQRIMPLGDSITYGSAAGATYRAELWNRLQPRPGIRQDFVGSVTSGSLPDPSHDGHPGWRIDQIAANVDDWTATYRPDVVLLHIGTNDMNQNHDVGNAPARLGALVDRIAATGAAVIVASIIPANDAPIEARIRDYNAAIPDLVRGRAAAGMRVYHVDMHSVLTTADLADTLHPNDVGYTKMGVAWDAAVRAIN